MPGATDEFYFFKRARVNLTNSNPTLLDAISAMTNQTLIRARFHPPFLLLCTAEDPLEPTEKIGHAATAERLQKKKFADHVLYNDRDWDSLFTPLAFDLNVFLLPRPLTIEANHFYRHSFVANDLTQWEQLEALAFSGRTSFTIEKRKIIFSPDARAHNPPPTEGISTFGK